MRGLPEGQQLRTFASQAVVDLDRIRGDLETGAVTPEDALDRLRVIGDQLSGHMDALAGAVAVASSKKQKEQQLVRDATRRRRGTRRRSTTIISTTDPGWTWYSIDSFRAGYEAGRTEVQRSRSSSSSSGSTSGFSSSGGSFSGAGSSSRF